MDTITHGIVGALAGKAFFAGHDVPAVFAKGRQAPALSSPTARAAIVACTLGAMFPDIDIFAGPLARNPLAIMEWHRNVTHSAIMLPLWALILALISVPLGRLVKWETPTVVNLFIIYAVAIGTHIFLDLVTSFGTMAWSPLNDSRPAWDWIFILDLSLTALALVPQFAAWCFREPAQFRRRSLAIWALLTAGGFGTYLFASASGYGFPEWVCALLSAIFAAILFLPAASGAGFRWTRARWCRAGLAMVCAYIALAAATHRRALAQVQKFAAEQHLSVESLAALPLPPTFTHWVGIVSTPEGVWRTTFHEPSGSVENTQLYLDAKSIPMVEEAVKLRDVQIYLWFARFPVWRVVRREGNETALEISDVRFFREGDPLVAGDPPASRSSARAARPRRAGFTFQIIFDAHGRVISDGFKEPE